MRSKPKKLNKKQTTYRMKSKYPGRCDRCKEEIKVGELIHWTPDAGKWHSKCASIRTEPKEVTDKRKKILNKKSSSQPPIPKYKDPLPKTILKQYCKKKPVGELKDIEVSLDSEPPF